MKQKSFLLVLAVFIICVALAVGLSQKPGFHTASSAPEKALDDIFKLGAADHDLFGFIFNAATYQHTKDAQFAPFFSPALLARSAQEEKDGIAKSCGGTYPADGKPCHILWDINPLYCAQNLPNEFLYRTIKSNGHEALVTYMWPGDKPDQPVYRLVKDDGRWVLDAISCSGKTPS
jgi:hypothetical protein